MSDPQDDDIAATEQSLSLQDDVATRLETLDELPVEEHVAVYDEIHRRLRDELVDGPPPDAAAQS